MIIYGIKNCNTVKKALDWLKENKIEFEFHDFKRMEISDEKIQAWQEKASWESLINKRGTTWRKLPVDTQQSVVDAISARKLMQDSTSVIKRPVIESNADLLIGFDEEEYRAKLL